MRLRYALLVVVMGMFLPLGCGSPGDRAKTRANAPWRVLYVRAKGLRATLFRDAQHGWAAGAGGVLLSDDGGKTWRQVARSASSGDGLTCMSSTDTMHVWAAGHAEVVFSRDGGATWARSEVPGDLTGIDFCDDETGWSVGTTFRGTVESAIWRSRDGGATWVKQLARPGSLLEDVDAVDARHAWAVGGRPAVILSTADGGATWRTKHLGTNSMLKDVTFTDLKHGWAVGSQGTIIATIDGGFHWRVQRTGPTSADTLRPVFMAVSFTNRLNGWAVGAAVSLSGGDVACALRTTDGGAHWLSAPPGLSQTLRGMSWPDARHGFAVGDTVVLGISP